MSQAHALIAVVPPVAVALTPEELARQQLADERRLIERVQGGERGAFRALVERYHRRVHAIVFRLVRNPADAEDIAQQAFVNAYDAIGSFRLELRFSSWLYRIAVNLARDFLKSHKRGEEGLGFLDEAVADGEALFAGRVAAPESGRQTSEVSRLLERALQRLSFEDRTVLLLKDVEELPYEELKRILGRPVTALKIRVVRARARLRKAIEALGGEAP